MMRFAQSFFRPDDVLQVDSAPAVPRKEKKLRHSNEGPLRVAAGRFAAVTAAVVLSIGSTSVLVDTASIRAERAGAPATLTLETIQPGVLRAWAASRWGERKGPRPTATGMKDLLHKIRTSLAK